MLTELVRGIGRVALRRVILAASRVLRASGVEGVPHGRQDASGAAVDAASRGGDAQCRALLDAAPDATVVIDAHGLIVMVNVQAERMFGYARAELVGRPVEVLIPERTRGCHQDHVCGFLARPEVRPMGHGGGLLVGRRHDGSEFPTEIALSPVTGNSGPLIVAAIRDVTERSRAEAQREAAAAESLVARAQLQALVECAPDLVLSVDRQGIVQFVNRTIPGHSRNDLLGAPWRRFLSPDQHRAVQAALDGVLETGLARSLETTSTIDPASPRWFSSNIGPIWHGLLVVGAVILSREVTDQKRIEAQLIASDRMAALGALAAGVGHEINNPLAAVIANLELALQELDGPPAGRPRSGELREELRDARDAAEKIRAIVRDLKIFARAEVDTTGPVSLRQVVESTVRMARNQVRHRARLVVRHGDATLVEANEARLGQVLLNLVVNAAQAIPEGNAQANEIQIVTRLEASGGVVMEVSDTGSGIAPEVMERLFTPFFTTKPAGIGTGLGLAICQRIVMGFGGRLSVESEVGKGSTFRVHLRQARRCPGTLTAPVTAPEVAVRRGRVLVVDDEATIGQAISRILSREHQVVTTTSAREALALVTAGERFDVILCDLMMPEVSGMDLHEQLVRIAPELARRMIFVSGGAFTVRAREFFELTPNARLDKPFDQAQLRAVVNAQIA